MSKRQKWGYGSFGVGLGLAIAFFAAFAATSGNLATAFLAAAMVCVVAAANGVAVGASDSVTTGKWVGLVVGVLGFVGWGIAWIADSSDLKASFGWAAVFSAIAALASLVPELFGGSSAPAQT